MYNIDRSLNISYTVNFGDAMFITDLIPRDDQPD